MSVIERTPYLSGQSYDSKWGTFICSLVGPARWRQSVTLYGQWLPLVCMGKHFILLAGNWSHGGVFVHSEIQQDCIEHLLCTYICIYMECLGGRLWSLGTESGTLLMFSVDWYQFSLPGSTGISFWGVTFFLLDSSGKAIIRKPILSVRDGVRWVSPPYS